MPTTMWPVRTRDCRAGSKYTQLRSTAFRRATTDRKSTSHRAEEIERVGEVFGQTRRVELEMPHDPVQIRIGGVQNLMEPVHQFDVRIAAQFATPWHSRWP